MTLSSETPAVPPRIAAADAYRTPKSWAEAQLGHVDELLLEQAHLEKKAAAAAVGYLFRLPSHPRLHRQLSALGREELVHFERTLKLMDRRGVAYGKQESSGYAERLKKAVRKDQPERLIDELLVAALIEHRSHERMSLLAEAFAATEPEVAQLYADLCPSEERHEELYLQLAELVAASELGGSDSPEAIAACRADVLTRHAELQAHERRVLLDLPFAPRLHSGVRDRR
ncbi:MAG: tRNA isopentenyl-2-thiomethyl-A-37 hydroxylase MiaE [Planctomycetota bacterium]